MIRGNSQRQYRNRERRNRERRNTDEDNSRDNSSENIEISESDNVTHNQKLREAVEKFFNEHN
jgi:hypothetical protein